MQLKVPLDHGFLPASYTTQAKVTRKNQPIQSFPIELIAVPKQAQSLAIFLIDYDAVPLTGFPFIHWLVANIPITDKIPVDFSRSFTGPQGQTSWMSRFYHLDDSYFSNHYAGPNPPGHAHSYSLTVLALKQTVQIQNGFYYNEFRYKLRDHIIETAMSQLRSN